MARRSKGQSERTAYLVLGMHRSGTSAVTQLLALCGAGLPQNLMAGDQHNARGYFEPWKIALFNSERLHAAGTAWDDPFVFPFRPLNEADEASWRHRARALFEEEFGEAPFPLLKDPRVTPLLPFWREVLSGLGLGARCVIPVRHPLAVAGSLKRRDGFPVEKSLLLWTSYMLAAEVESRELPRAFVGYDALLADWRREVARIEAAHGAPLPKPAGPSASAIDDFLTPELRHNAEAGELSAYGWAGALTVTVHAWFAQAAAGETPDRAPLAAAAAELARRQAEFGVLVSPVTRDLDVARIELEDLQRRIEIEARWAADREQDLRNVAAAREHQYRGEAEARIAKLQAELQATRAEIEVLNGRWAEAGARLDAILAEG